MIGSVIGCTQSQRDTVRGLGLRRLHQLVEREDTPEIRGMVRKIPHLAEIVEQVPGRAGVAGRGDGEPSRRGGRGGHVGLHNLKPAKGAVTGRKRVGRGPGSGLGKTSGRGEKGQKSRSGFARRVGFEGGQMPLHRRVPKRGFHNPFRKEFAEVNLEKLEAFEAGTIVTPELLLKRGILHKLRDGVKILGKGELTKPLTVRAHRFSARAQDQIVGKAR